MKKSMCSIIILMMMATSTVFAIDQNQKIVYDKDNYLVFEDVGRNTTYNTNGQATAATFGFYVRIHVCRDGKLYDIDLVDPKYPDSDPDWQIVKPRTVAIKYADKDNVWFVNEGHTGQRAVLYNIVDKKVVKTYWGLGVRISPDGRKVASVVEDLRETGKRKRGSMLFVNDTMFYPYVESGFTKWDQFQTDLEHRIEKANGTTPADYLKTKPEPQNHLVQDLAWKDDNTLTFDVNDRNEDTSATRYLATGLADIGTSRTLKIDIRKDGMVNLRSKN